MYFLIMLVFTMENLILYLYFDSPTPVSSF